MLCRRSSIEARCRMLSLAPLENHDREPSGQAAQGKSFMV
jgi:hypothetical protein